MPPGLSHSGGPGLGVPHLERRVMTTMLSLYEKALEHIKIYPCPVCMEESPKELCPLWQALKVLKDIERRSQ